MEIKGKVHCFFEQSGSFKNEFIKLGIPAEDYDIQNNFGETAKTELKEVIFLRNRQDIGLQTANRQTDILFSKHRKKI